MLSGVCDIAHPGELWTGVEQSVSECHVIRIGRTSSDVLVLPDPLMEVPRCPSCLHGVLAALMSKESRARAEHDLVPELRGRGESEINMRHGSCTVFVP